MIEEVLGFCTVVLSVAGLVSLSVWFCCSAVERIVKLRRRLKNSRYNALLKENERLKGFLADVEESSFPRKVHYPQRTPRPQRTRRKSTKAKHSAA